MRVTPRVIHAPVLVLLLGTLCAIATSACTPLLDTTRMTQAPRTPGEIIYEELCNRVASAADSRDVAGKRTRPVCRDGASPAAGAAPRLVALHGQRARFVQAVNVALQGPQLAGDLQHLLSALMPLYDDGTMGRQIAASVDMTRSLRDRTAATALARLARAPQPASHSAASVLHATLRYPHTHELLGSLLSFFGAQPHQLELRRAVYQRLQDEPQDLLLTDAATYAIMRDMLLRPVPHARPGGAARVLRDARGLPQPRLVGGALPPPLVDCNHDGMADANAAGRFIDCTGRILDVPSPFTPGGEAMFEHIDLAQSGLYGMVHLARQLGESGHTDQHPLLSLATTMDAALRPTRQTHDGALGTYEVYNPEASPLVDVAAALGWLVEQGGMGDLMEVMGQLVEQDEAALAGVVNLIWQAYDWAQAPNMASQALEAHASLMDDALDLGAEIASTPDLLKDVLTALQDPNTQRLGHLMAAHMRTLDRIDFDPANINGPPLGHFSTPVNRALPDGVGNMSVMQRLVWLVHDARQPMCNADNAIISGQVDYGRCDLFEVPDAALFYLKAILGQGEFTIHFKPEDEVFIESLAPPDAPGAFGLAGVREVRHEPCRHPVHGDERICVTYNVDPAGAARFLFVPFSNAEFTDEWAGILQNFHDTTEEMTADGKPFSALHASTLFAWEIDDFFGAIRPLLHAFANHQREDLVVKGLDLLHRHYATPANPTVQSTDARRWDYSRRSGIVRFEPLIARLLDDAPQTGDAFAVLRRFLEAAAVLESGNGKKGDALIARAAGHAMSPRFATSAALAGDPRRFLDGPTDDPQGDKIAVPKKVHTVTPLHVARRAIDHLSQTCSKHPRVLDEGAMRRLLAVEPVGSGLRLANRQVHGLLTPLAGAAQAWLHMQHGHSGLAVRWKQQTSGFIGDPLVSSSLHLATALAADSRVASELSPWLTYLLHEETDALVGAMADLLQSGADVHTLEPLLRASAVALVPHSGLVDAGAELLEKVRARDEGRALARLLPGLATPMGTGIDAETPLQALSDIYQRVNRVDPASPAVLDVADFGDDNGILGRLEGFLLDDRHGFVRLLDLVASRHGGEEGTP